MCDNSGWQTNSLIRVVIVTVMTCSLSCYSAFQGGFNQYWEVILARNGPEEATVGERRRQKRVVPGSHQMRKLRSVRDNCASRLV